jgi:hypothetical protein
MKYLRCLVPLLLLNFASAQVAVKPTDIKPLLQNQVVGRATSGSGAGEALTFAGTTGEVTVTFGTGTVTSSLPTALNFTGKTITGGTFTGGAFPAASTLTFGTHLTGTSYNGSAPVTIATDATSANTVSTIVARDGSGNFSAGTITANITGNISGTAPAGTLTGTALASNVVVKYEVATIAALKAISVTAMTTNAGVNVLGYYAAGDGGGGVYYYDSTSSATDNGGTVIAPTVGSGRWLLNYKNVVSVKQFGAKGDGVTNDTTCVQNALNLCRALNNNTNLTTTLEINFPTGYYCVQNLNLYTKTAVRLRGPGIWNRNRVAGAVLQPFDGTEAHLLRVGYYNSGTENPTTNDYFASAISIDGLNFSGATSISGTPVDRSLTDALLVFDAANCIDVKNVQFWHGTCRAVRIKNCWEHRWENIRVDAMGNWATSLFKVDNIYSGGGNNSAMMFDSFFWETCRGTLFETAGITNSDFQFHNWNVEWGLGGTVINNFATDVDTYVPLLLLPGLSASQFTNFVTTNLGYLYDNYAGVKYSYDAVFEFGSQCFGNLVNGLAVLQSKKIAAVSTASDITYCELTVKNVTMGYPVTGFIDVYYRFRCKSGIRADRIEFGGIAGKALSISLDRINSNPPLLGYVPATELCAYRNDWGNGFAYDTSSLWHNRQVFLADKTLGGSQHLIAVFPSSVLSLVRTNIRFRIRVKALGDSTAVPGLLVVYTDSTTDTFDFPTATDTTNFKWLDFTLEKRYFDGGTGKTISYIGVIRGFTSGTKDGSFYFDGVVIEPTYLDNATTVKSSRVTTGLIGAGSTALVTLTWGTSFADANYTVSASVEDSTATSLSLSVVHVETKTASAVTVRVINNAVGSLTGTLNVIAIHD